MQLLWAENLKIEPLYCSPTGVMDKLLAFTNHEKLFRIVRSGIVPGRMELLEAFPFLTEEKFESEQDKNGDSLELACAAKLLRDYRSRTIKAFTQALEDYRIERSKSNRHKTVPPAWREKLSLTIAEAAGVLECSERHVFNLIRESRLKKPSKGRVTTESVEALLEEIHGLKSA